MTTAQRILASYPPIQVRISQPVRQSLPPALPQRMGRPDSPYANAGR